MANHVAVKFLDCLIHTDTSAQLYTSEGSYSLNELQGSSCYYGLCKNLRGKKTLHQLKPDIYYFSTCVSCLLTNFGLQGWWDGSSWWTHAASVYWWREPAGWVPNLLDWCDQHWSPTSPGTGRFSPRGLELNLEIHICDHSSPQSPEPLCDGYVLIQASCNLHWEEWIYKWRAAKFSDYLWTISIVPISKIFIPQKWIIMNEMSLFLYYIFDTSTVLTYNRSILKYSLCSSDFDSCLLDLDL